MRAVGGKAEEIGGRIAQRRILRRRRAVDDGHVRLGLGVILDRQPFVAGQRTDQDLHAVLLDQLAHRANRAVRRTVGRTFDDLDLLATDLAAEIVDGHEGAAHAVVAEYGEGPFERGEHTNFDGVFGHSDGRDYQSRGQTEAEKRASM